MAYQFSDEDMGLVTRELSELGIEKTPAEWRQWLVYICELHCLEFPNHRQLTFPELWLIVQARLNDDHDGFPNVMQKRGL